MSTDEIIPYKNLLYADLDFHRIAPYNASQHTPIHRWNLIPESPSIEWAKVLMSEAEHTNYSFVMDPFVGSGSVALQAVTCSKNFIGGDLLADLVIASRGKAYSPKLDFEDFAHYADLLPQIVDSFFSNGILDHVKPTHNEPLFEVLLKIQNYILTTKASLPCKYVLLTSLYGSLRFLSRTLYISQGVKLILEWKQYFESVLDYVKEDLKNNKKIINASRFVICHGDSTQTDWQMVLGEVQSQVPAKGLLLTSPTYVQTSQDQTGFVQMCRMLGSQALMELGNRRNFVKKEGLDSTILERVLYKTPIVVRENLKTLAHVLVDFGKIATPSSWAIIANENPQFGANSIEVDLYICLLAERLGYSPMKIRITHYLEQPGKIASHQTRRRGSIIYLELK